MNNPFLPSIDVSVVDTKASMSPNKSLNQAAKKEGNGFSESLKSAEKEYSSQETQNDPPSVTKTDTAVSQKPQESEASSKVSKQGPAVEDSSGAEQANNGEDTALEATADVDEALSLAVVIDDQEIALSELSEEDVVTKINDLADMIVDRFPQLEALKSNITQHLEKAYHEGGALGLQQALIPDELNNFISSQLTDTAEILSVPLLNETIKSVFTLQENNKSTINTLGNTSKVSLEARNSHGYNQNLTPKVEGFEVPQLDGQQLDIEPVTMKPIADGNPLDKAAKNLQMNDLSLKMDTQAGNKLMSDTLTSQTANTQASLSTAPAVAANALPKAQLQVAMPFQQSQWGQAVAERVVWMTGQNIQEAEVHMDPPELGPIQVKVSIANEQAHVSFVVQHGSVREALDQSSMRLREMFEGEGLNLVDVDVSEHSQQQAQEEGEERAQGDANDMDDEDALQSSSSSPVNQYSLVNTYV